MRTRTRRRDWELLPAPHATIARHNPSGHVFMVAGSQWRDFQRGYPEAMRFFAELLASRESEGWADEFGPPPFAHRKR